jgi:type I restriction enzyme, S subunit
VIVSPNISGEKYLRQNSVESFKSCLRDDIQAIRLKYVIAQSITDGPHLTPEFTLSGFPFLSVDGIQDGELIFENCRFISENDHYEFRKKAAPQYGDILLGKAASTGKIARVKTTKEFSIWSPLALIRPSSDVISSAFLEYALKSLYLQVQIEDLCSFNTQKNISMGAIPNLVIPLPSLEEQQKITDYIDRETTQIDNLIAAKEQMLTLLEEKRAALISHAVTRGLDPNVAFKRSGLDWLGDIPQHWNIERAKNLFSVRDERSDSGDEELLSVSHITGVTSRADKQVNMFKAEDMTGYKRCTKGDFVTNTLWGWMGAMGVSPLDGIVSPDYHVYIFKGDLLPEFMELLCRSKPFIAEVVRWSKGVWSSRLRIYPENFFEIRFPVPPKSEQLELIDKVAEEDEKNKELKNSLTDSIALLKERRSALITAAVTGQITLEEMKK